MVRKAHAELECGLYHVITRGNNRAQIFNSRADYQKFLSLLAVQKSKLSFFFYAADEGRILGSEEFIDETIHRIGETDRSDRSIEKKASPVCEFEPYDLVAVVEKVCRIPRENFCGPCKSAPAIMSKEMLILIGLQMGASTKLLSEIIGISSSALSRRHDAARLKVRDRRKRQ